jgi:PPIC-type PPIASE domain
LLAVPVLSACDTSPGAAALVGSTRITTGELQSEVNHALADPAVRAIVFPSGATASQVAERGEFTRQTLARLIGDRLVTVLAAQHHVTVSPEEVRAEQASFVQQAGSLEALQQTAAQQVGVGASQLGPLLRITVMQQKLGTALTEALPASPAQLQAEYQKDIDNYDQLEIAQIAVVGKQLADRLLVKVRANPSAFPALAQKYSIDPTSKANGGLVGFVPRSQVISLLGAHTSVAPGTFAVAHSSQQYVVLHVISRRVEPLSAVTDKLKAALYAAQAQTLLGKAITVEGEKLGVHVSPRYGHWSNSSQSVLALKSPVSTAE